MTNREIEDVRLNVADWQERSVVNGPGERFVMWLQGCPFRCVGCFNQDFLPFRAQHVMTVTEMANHVRSIRGIEGITISGGEPTSQSRGLFHLCRLLQADGMSVFCYTGYTLDELRARRNRWVERFLSCVDVLVDGRYEQTQRANLRWRGSANQRVHFLSKRYASLAGAQDSQPSETEFTIGRANFTTTGIFDPAFVSRLEELLREGLT